LRGHRLAPQISDDEETVEHKLIFAIGRRRRLSAWGQDDSD